MQILLLLRKIGRRDGSARSCRRNATIAYKIWQTRHAAATAWTTTRAGRRWSCNHCHVFLFHRRCLRGRLMRSRARNLGTTTGSSAVLQCCSARRCEELLRSPRRIAQQRPQRHAGTSPSNTLLGADVLPSCTSSSVLLRNFFALDVRWRGPWWSGKNIMIFSVSDSETEKIMMFLIMTTRRKIRSGLLLLNRRSLRRRRNATGRNVLADFPG